LKLKQLEHNAIAFFESGYNCAEAVSQAIIEAFSDATPEDIPRVASAFGGGIGTMRRSPRKIWGSGKLSRVRQAGRPGNRSAGANFQRGRLEICKVIGSPGQFYYSISPQLPIACLCGAISFEI